MFTIDEISLSRLTEEIGIDKESIAELLSIYCSEMKEEIQQVRITLHNQDWINLQRTVHNIKGVSANLSLQGIFEASAELDSMLKSKNYIGIEAHAQQLLEVLETTINNIKKALEQYHLNSKGL
ncbi:MAG: Hpt protein [Clostridia bacterium]|nr:Hpt protein [Clostridia bacterium]